MLEEFVIELDDAFQHVFDVQRAQVGVWAGEVEQIADDPPDALDMLLNHLDFAEIDWRTAVLLVHQPDAPSSSPIGMSGLLISWAMLAAKMPNRGEFFRTDQ